MFATIIAILLSTYLFFYGGSWSPGALFPFSIAASAILLSFGAAALLVSFLPIQKGEQNITPRLAELFRKDLRINLGLAFLFCLPLIIIAASFLTSPIIPILLLLGIGIDTLYLLIRRIMDYLNPFRVIDFLKSEGFNAIDADADGTLCNVIESCAEVAVKSIQRHNGALSNHALNAIEEIGEDFLASTKSLGHTLQSRELKAEGIPDSISYVLLYLFQHLEAIFSQSLDKKLDLTAGHIITILTKLAIYATRIDLSLVTLPLYYLDKFAAQALEKNILDVSVKATIGLQSIAKVISETKEIQYQDLKTPFITIISSLDKIAKETFKKDKSIKIAILKHPFKQLATLLDQEPIKSHQDRQAIVQQINLVLDEFTALESVLLMMPPMPNILPEDEAPLTP